MDYETYTLNLTEKEVLTKHLRFLFNRAADTGDFDELQVYGDLLEEITSSAVLPLYRKETTSASD